MAATSNLPSDEDKDSFPSAAPTPLPPPQPQGRLLGPDPEVALTPERDAVGKGGHGILQQRHQGKIPRRQVRFRLGSISLDPPMLPEEAQRSHPEGSHITIALTRQPSNGSAGEELPQLPRNPLATPVLCSTLALGAEVQVLQKQGFNARQAAEDLLQRSFLTRCAVEARVSEGTNIPRDQQLFKGLVSLHVPEDELLNLAVQDKRALIRHRSEARQEAPGAGPDPLAFYNPKELFTETPSLEVEGLPPLRLQPPRPRDSATTFFMYQKLCQWDS